MSKFEHFLALFLPTITTGIICGGVYLWHSFNGDTLGYIGIMLVLTGILSAVFYAKKLHSLPEAKLINSPETDILRVYMRGALIASFIPQAISLALGITLTGSPNDGVAVVSFTVGMLFFALLPFVFYPMITFICLFGAGVGMDAYRIWGVLLIVCLITRTVIQSMCFLATNKRIDYENSRVGGVLMTMTGTINIIFWLESLRKVKKFAQIEREKGICQ